MALLRDTSPSLATFCHPLTHEQLQLPERRFTVKQSNKIQTHGTKRRSRESPKLTVRKRPRPCVDITTSLSPDEIQVLSKAATILQVELSDLAGLAKTRNLQPRGVQKDNKSQAVSEEISPQRYLSSQVSNMENMPHQSRFSTHPPKSKSKNQSDSSSATPFDSTSDDICHLPSFDLGLIPEQIADCLASFKSPTSRISLPVTPRGRYSHHHLQHDHGITASY